MEGQRRMYELNFTVFGNFRKIHQIFAREKIRNIKFSGRIFLKNNEYLKEKC